MHYSVEIKCYLCVKKTFVIIVGIIKQLVTLHEVNMVIKNDAI